jgi:hypothetical protein
MVYATDLKDIIDNVTNPNLEINFDSEKENIRALSLEWYHLYLTKGKFKRY